MNKIIVEIIDTAKEHKWRMGYRNTFTEWTSHYEGLLVLEMDNGEKWGYATAYWDGVLPIEIPFSILKCRKDAFQINVSNK